MKLWAQKFWRIFRLITLFNAIILRRNSKLAGPSLADIDHQILANYDNVQNQNYPREAFSVANQL